jgi:hypothetical protein
VPAKSRAERRSIRERGIRPSGGRPGGVRQVEGRQAVPPVVVPRRAALGEAGLRESGTRELRPREVPQLEVFLRELLLRGAQPRPSGAASRARERGCWTNRETARTGPQTEVLRTKGFSLPGPRRRGHRGARIRRPQPAIPRAGRPPRDRPGGTATRRSTSAVILNQFRPAAADPRLRLARGRGGDREAWLSRRRLQRSSPNKGATG